MTLGEADWPSRFHIAPAKITAYLLNLDDLRDALLAQCRRADFRSVHPGYGAVKLYFEGPLAALIGLDPQVRTVWQIDEGNRSQTARLITLKPPPRP